jgi:2-polyprenyl-6-methoxyphenol hydroxylase-like FAD-dependent oxidoreductase
LPLAAALPRPGTTAAGLIPVRPRLFDEPGALDRALDDFLRSDPEVAQIVGTRRFPEDLTRIRLTWGHAKSYGGEGVILIGDAAHPVTPAGGQGANAAIADARALADIALRDESDLVAAFERRRRPANERSQSPSRAIVPVFSLPDWLLFSAAPQFARLIRWFPGLPARGLRFASTAFTDQLSTDRSL